MSAITSRRVSQEYNLNPGPESLSEVREALMTRMDIMERNLGRVIQRVLIEVNALRKENEMLKTHLAKQPPPVEVLQVENGCVKVIQEESYKKIFESAKNDEETPLKDAPNKKEKITKINAKKERKTINATDHSTFEDPLNEMETDNNTMQMQEFDPDTFHNFGGSLPVKPFTLKTQFEHFEKELEKDVRRFAALVIDFKSVQCPQGERYVRQCLRNVLSNELAVEYTYYGTLAKKNFSATKTIEALRAAFTHKFGDYHEAFEKAACTFFHYTKDRMTKLEKRKRLEATL